MRFNNVNAALGVVGATLGVFLGGMDGLLYALIAVIAIDYSTGVMCALVEKKLSSEIGLKGIFKKAAMVAIVGVAHTLDKHVIGDGSLLRSASVLFFISNEGISLLENAARLGLPVPDKLKEALVQLLKKETGAADNENK